MITFPLSICKLLWASKSVLRRDSRQPHYRLLSLNIRFRENNCSNLGGKYLHSASQWSFLQVCELLSFPKMPLRDVLCLFASLVDKSVMMYNIVNNMVPDYLSSQFVFRSDTFLTYNLRDSDSSLAIPQPRTNYCKRSLSYSGAVLWNSLPLDIRQSPSLDEFKSKLMNYFDGRCM